MRRLTRRLTRWLHTGARAIPKRRGAWASVCLAAGAAVLLAVLSGSARLDAGARRPRAAAVTQDDASNDPLLNQNARHMSVFTARAQTYKGFVTREYADASGASMTYYLYIPPAVSAEASAGLATRFPVVVLLHGIGESARVSSTAAQNRDRILGDPYVNLWSSAAVQAKWPSFIIVPQAITPNRWVDAPPHLVSYNLNATPSTSLALAHEILDATLDQYATSVDRQRVYITGISMGGAGVWDAIERWPQEFAAAAPVSGAGDPAEAFVLAKMPIWVFQGALDTTLPVAASVEMVNAISAAGGQPRLTEVQGASHVIWLQVYRNPTFLAWLFAQRASA
ncbi:MAG TPA: dienelactone hydrolase family protein [Ktedonobacterales bacterium]|nr:dienelactone hydrolase family protein [Ktedonobacterales bacterium]